MVGPAMGDGASRSGPAREWAIRLLLLVLASAAAVSVARGSQNALAISQDFAMRWTSVKLVTAGEDPIAVELGRARSPLLEELSSDPRVAFYGALPPSSLLVFYPYAPLDFDSAILAWLVTNLLATAAFVWLLWKLREESRDPPLHFALILILLAGTPFRVTLGNGQVGIIAMAFLLGAIHLDRRGRSAAAGVALALSLAKFHLTIPYIFFLFVLEARWRALAVGAAIHLAAHFALCAHTGVSPFAVWADIAQATVSTASYSGSLDLPSVLGRFTAAGSAIGLALLLAGCAGLTLVWRRLILDATVLEQLSLLTLLTLVVPTNRGHDYFVLIFPLAWALGQTRRPWVRGVTLVCVLYFFFGERALFVVAGGRYGDASIIDPVWLLSVSVFYVGAAVLTAAHLGRPAASTSLTPT